MMNQAVEKNKPVASGKKPTKKGKHLDDSDDSDTEEARSAEPTPLVSVPTIPVAKKANISDEEVCFEGGHDGQVNVAASATSKVAQAKVAAALPPGTPKAKKYFVYLITAAMYIEELIAKNPKMSVLEAHRLCEGRVAKIGTNHILYK